MPRTVPLTTLAAHPETVDDNTRRFLDEAEASRFDFHGISSKAAGDEKLKAAVGRAVTRSDSARRSKLLELPDADRLRALAGEIKQHALDHLDYYLDQLRKNVERRGGVVHFASSASDARRIVLDIIAQTHSKSVIKSKSMASEEIGLAHALEAAGVDVVETDLGEFIIQISHDRPSHLVAPIIHKDRASIGRLFSDYFGTPYTDDPVALTMQARAFLRDKFKRADLGMTGGNFLVADSGLVCTVENEGNVRHSVITPRVLVSLVGIEKVIPRMIDLSVMLKLLARSATGQSMTVYTNLFGGTRAARDRDGPEAFHLVLIDNGRSSILAGEYRETLRCIRCGACLNACPIYRSVGGHSYGSVYPGPIGALITPLMQGLDKFKDLPQASSLCGACFEACPVKIDIPRHLINLRRDIAKQKLSSPAERFVYRMWAKAMRSRRMYGLGTFAQKAALRLLADDDGWIAKLPPPARGWTLARDMPQPARRTFHQLWKSRSRKGGPK